MKKTLMVLSLTLCAAFAFAQTKHASVQRHADKAAAVSQNEEASYKASIFSKDDVVLHQWNFEANNAGFTTGKFTSTITVAGTEYQAHGQGTNFSQWQRIPSPEAAVLSNESVYPVSYDYGEEFWKTRMDSSACSSYDGFMFMSMQDQIQNWGGSGDRGVFHSYIEFDGVSTASADVVDVRLFQFYRKFNADQCFVDYTFDGTTWKTLEINVRGVDVSVNNSMWGRYTFTMPFEVAGKENVKFRIRWYAATNNGGAYGYLWALDDFTVIGGKANRLRLAPENYVEGAYQIMPKGLQLPVSWAMNIINNGTIDQNSVRAGLFNEDGSRIGSWGRSQNLTPDPATKKTMAVDGLSWLSDSADANSQGWYGYAAYWNNIEPTQTNTGLNTAAEGWHGVYAAFESDSIELRSFDTIQYFVNDLDEDGYAIWGVDNGVLTAHQQFTQGFDENGEYISDEGQWHQAGYSVSVRYTTGAEIPEGWVLHGVELVAATKASAATAGKVISAEVYQDIYDGSTVYFGTVNTGANTYTVKAEDLNDSATIAQAGGYLEWGDYNTIRIMFPEQPELEPYSSYRIGYVLENTGFFSVADIAGRYYGVPNSEGTGDSAVYWTADPSTEKYATNFQGANLGYGINNGYSMYLQDRESQWAGFYASSAPMIRAIVGPRKEVERIGVSATCQRDEDNELMGVVTWFGDTICEDAAQVALGSTPVFSIVPTDNYAIVEVKLDGQVIEPWDEDEETGNENLREHDRSDQWKNPYMTLSIPEIDATHEIAVTYEWHPVSVDPVASNVRMSLQPNPATSNVNLSIEGVEGMVNCSIIDMSGRVVYNKAINAENAQVIDLSNMAKGAYFVRIVNDQFSKVEKLIVR